MFTLPRAPAHLLPLRMQREEPAFPPSPVRALHLPLLLPLSPLLTMPLLSLE